MTLGRSLPHSGLSSPFRTQRGDAGHSQGLSKLTTWVVQAVHRAARPFLWRPRCGSVAQSVQQWVQGAVTLQQITRSRQKESSVTPKASTHPALAASAPCSSQRRDTRHGCTPLPAEGGSPKGKTRAQALWAGLRGAEHSTSSLCTEALAHPSLPFRGAERPWEDEFCARPPATLYPEPHRAHVLHSFRESCQGPASRAAVRDSAAATEPTFRDDNKGDYCYSSS